MFSLETLISNPLLFLAGFIALAVSIGIHEFAHVLTAYVQGDRTGEQLGRLTLNPLKHLDPIGTIAIVVAGIGWGRPAPFNPLNLRNRRWGPALVALGGPISNIFMVVLAGYTLVLVQPALGPENLLTILLQTLVILNAALAVFNIIPIPPLDGSHLLRAVLGEDHEFVRTLERYGVFILLALLFLGGDLLRSFMLRGVDLILTLVGLGGFV